MKPRRKYTVPQAKNLMRRATEEIVDPGPRSVDQLWEFFNSRCVYCGRELNRGLREGHVDHAEPAGGNHLGNLVLACGGCNGDEKREADWRVFLSLKAGDEATFREREARILRWFALNPPPAALASAEVTRIRGEVDELVAAFGAKCAELRDPARCADLERLEFHDLRHTFASLMIAAGANPLQLAEALGHTDRTGRPDPTLVWKRYGHLYPGSTREAAAALDRHLKAAAS